MYCVYALFSKRFNRIYVGITNNLERRIKEHNKGKTRSTKFYKPWIVFYKEYCQTRKKARFRERFLKSGVGREFLKDKLHCVPVAQLDRASAF
ncbi:MAG: GIY-YIG nuclease family protein [Candidatus Omnitrophica bacterium]|nr:GIY-YIG nuclease family protein [Candidatus Omnitrophota bacterium]